MTNLQPIILRVPGVPRPQPRPQSCGFVGVDKETGVPIARARSFNKESHSLKAWKANLRIAAYKFRPQEPWTQAVRVDVEAFFPRPAWLVNVLPDQAMPMLERPDRDNLDKTILDTLTGLKYWADDSQVYVGRLAKFYVAAGCAPGAIVSITFIELEPAYLAAVEKHAGKVAEDREKREERKRRGPIQSRPRPVYNAPRLINETISIDQLASEIAAGRKVRV